jgi:hypothetical protein
LLDTSINDTSTTFSTNNLPQSSGRRIYALQLSWYIGGALNVTSTFLTIQPHRATDSHIGANNLYGNATDDVLDTLLANTDQNQHILHSQHINIASPIYSGSSRWGDISSATSSNENPQLGSISQIRSHYRQIMKIHVLTDISTNANTISSIHKHRSSGYDFHLLPGEYFLTSWTGADTNYASTGQGYPQDLSPQSHYVRLRTESNYQVGGLQGRRYYSSSPVILNVHSNGSVDVSSKGLNCANWESIQLTLVEIDHNDMNSNVNDNSGASNMDNEEDYIKEMHQEVRESFLFVRVEALYVILFLIFLVAILGLSVYIEERRRQRVYSSVSSNRYLALPTGFQHV